MKSKIEQIKAEIAAYFTVREARAEPLTLVQEAIKADFADPEVSATTLRSDHKEVMSYVRETFSAREKALFQTMCSSDYEQPINHDESFVDRVLAREKLRNDDEFRDLASLVDSLIQTGDAESERVQKINRILAAWESRKSRGKSR